MIDYIYGLNLLELSIDQTGEHRYQGLLLQNDQD